MKLIFIACLAAVALAAPRPQDTDAPADPAAPDVPAAPAAPAAAAAPAAPAALAALAAPAARATPAAGAALAGIISDERYDAGDGNFNYAFETDDGTSVSAVGTPGDAGAVNIEGSYRFTLPDGNVVEIHYVADANGFQPTGDVIPTPHPLPAHAIEQIRFAEEQRAAGVTFE